MVLPPLKFRWSPNFGRRLLPVRLVVAHRPVGSYQSAIASMCDANHEAAAQVIIREDGREGTQLVPWNKKAWACRFFNSVSDNIEMPDWIWSGPMTEEKERVMRVCARAVAFRIHKRRLPCKFVGPAGRGWTTHARLGKAGGGHTDPTTDPQRLALFDRMVHEEFERGGFRRTWGWGDG